MTLEPLLSASPGIHIHVVAVVTSALLGAYVLLRRKGTRVRRLLGKICASILGSGPRMTKCGGLGVITARAVFGGANSRMSVIR